MKLTDLLGPQPVTPAFEQNNDSKYVPPLIREFAGDLPTEREEQAEYNTWVYDENQHRLVCDFYFDKPAALSRFVQEALDFQEDAQHHGVITIEPNRVHVEVWTHRLNDVTDLDDQYAGEMSDIYNDVVEVFNYVD